MRTLAPLALALVVFGCQSPLATSLNDATLQRQGLEGPYVAGTTEHFVLDVSPGAKVRWSASSGALTSRNAELEWTLVEGFATLTATLTKADGQQETREWHYQVEPEARAGATSAREALLATPIQVLDGGVETSGRACDVQYDSAGNAHIAFTTSTHPSVMYGRFNGSAWTIEVVDGLGFNVGGRVDDTQLRLQVEANGTPHLLYVRALASNQLWYATKSGTTWTRERVDTDTSRVSGRIALALKPGTMMQPHVVYTWTAGSQDRLAVAVRASAWTVNAFSTTLTGASSYERLQGDAAFVGANLVFPFIASVAPSSALASWTTGTTAAFVGVPSPLVDTQDMDLAVVSATRVLARSRQGVFDVAVAPTFSASTFAWSPSTIYGAEQGDLAWNGTKPVVMQELSGSLELATPNAEGYWLWTSLGTTSSTTAALALHPSTGAASICYQSAGRIMFQ